MQRKYFFESANDTKLGYTVSAQLRLTDSQFDYMKHFNEIFTNIFTPPFTILYALIEMAQIFLLNCKFEIYLVK